MSSFIFGSAKTPCSVSSSLRDELGFDLALLEVARLVDELGQLGDFLAQRGRVDVGTTSSSWR
jgi:hypothetical protein